jgi:phosphoribosylformylglycinamidine synthase
MKNHATPRALVFSGYGLNCEEETKRAFELAGGAADIVHVNDLITEPQKLGKYQIMAFPGGFSYGDDTGSGKAYANKVRNHLADALERFMSRDTLTIGICNGFQIITNLGLVPGALTHNAGARYLDRWVDVNVVGKSPWLAGIDSLSLPIAHGEGRFVADEKLLARMKDEGAIALRYVRGQACAYQDLAANPNGSLENIAGSLAREGRVFGLMPHPERAIFTSQNPAYPLMREEARRSGKKLPEYGTSLQIFKNAVRYFA